MKQHKYDKEKLHELKIVGHNLLDEYVGLDISKGYQVARRKAYEELQDRLDKRQSAHFGEITCLKEAVTANHELRMMIAKKRLKISTQFKAHFAPNLREVQKAANALNLLPI